MRSAVQSLVVLALSMLVGPLAPSALRAQSTPAAEADDDCALLQELIASTYDFQPSQLKSDEERDAKGKAMDRVWKTVKDKGGALLPCLRAALEAPGADAWFRFDGSLLLVELDPTPENKSLQVRCVTDVPLDDVDRAYWISVLSRLGYEGHDVSAAADKWLADPKARYTIPSHGMFEYKAEEGALFLLGSMDEAQATPALIRLVADRDHLNRDAAVRILTNQATPEALRALKDIDLSGLSEGVRRSVVTLRGQPELLTPSAAPSANREELRRALEGMLDGSQRIQDVSERFEAQQGDAVAVLSADDLTLLRKARRKIATVGNFHAIEAYETFTRILMAKVWTAELVK